MVMGLGIRSQIKREGKGTISGECRAGKVRQGLEAGGGRAQGRLEEAIMASAQNGGGTKV